jgi:hypothetical protein
MLVSVNSMLVVDESNCFESKIQEMAKTQEEGFNSNNLKPIIVLLVQIRLTVTNTNASN